jgi:hypothetical protein
MEGPMLNEDDRFQVEMTARATERRNSSPMLFFLALVVLGLCALMWVWGWRARSGAIGQLRRTQREQITLQAKLDEIASKQASPETGAGEPINDMGTRLKHIAERKDIGVTLPVPKERASSLANGVVKTYEYSEVSAPSPAPIIKWISAATSEIDGLEIATLQIDPDERDSKFKVTVQFRRWERQQ